VLTPWPALRDTGTCPPFRAESRTCVRKHHSRTPVRSQELPRWHKEKKPVAFALGFVRGRLVSTRSLDGLASLRRVAARDQAGSGGSARASAS
jgi:hypothetical protein